MESMRGRVEDFFWTDVEVADAARGGVVAWGTVFNRILR
jgi:hypothetical protein